MISMSTNINHEENEERGSRLGFIIVLLFFVSLVMFMLYYLNLEQPQPTSLLPNGQ